MAKGGNHKQYTEDWFLSKGYTKNADGSFQPPKFRNPLREPEKPNGIGQEPYLLVKKPLYPEFDIERKLTEITSTTTISTINESVLSIDGLVAGLNGDKGLMRSHWSNTKKQKDLYQMIIADHLREKKIRRHEGKVTIQFIGYKSVLMDWDNFCSSFKHIGDALVKSNIIVDDKPSVVIQFIPQQIKCKRVEQKVIVIIKDYQ
jgi:hypothetical protein